MPKYGGIVERPYAPCGLTIDEDKVDDVDAYPVTVSGFADRVRRRM
jgi:hypothetical protein